MEKEYKLKYEILTSYLKKLIDRGFITLDEVIMIINTMEELETNDK